MDEKTCNGYFHRSRKFVALLNVVIGTCGIVGVTYILYSNATRQINLKNGTEKLPFLASELDDQLSELQKEFIIYALLYIFPAVVTFCLGILLFLASRKERLAWSTACVLLNAVLILGSGGIVCIVFGLGVNWKLLIPVVLPTMIQVLLILVVFDLYRSRRNINSADISPLKW